MSDGELTRLCLLFLFGIVQYFHLPSRASKLVVFSFGEPSNDSALRQMDSASLNDVELTLIEPHGNVVQFNELETMKDYIGNLKDANETVVLFVDSGSLFLNSTEQIINKFQSLDARIVLSAISTCHPDPSLAESYPEVSESEKRFVEASGLMAYADTLLEALLEPSLQSISDRQYYFSKLFVDFNLRTKYVIKLDSKSEIFQNLDEKFDIRVEHSASGRGYLMNKVTNTSAVIVQQRKNKEFLNSLSNYLGKTWDPVLGCQHCSLNKLQIDDNDLERVPRVTVAIYIDQATPFLEEFFTRVSSLTYPKSRINIRVSNKAALHDFTTNTFIKRSQALYNSVEYVDSSANKSSAARRIDAIKSCVAPNCDYVLFLDSLVQLTNENTIQSLMAYNRSVIAPLVSRREQLWSNFWGAISQEGYYSRAFDYLDIVNGVKKGVWNVPHIHSVYLMKEEVLPKLHDVYAEIGGYRESEIDMLFSANMRNKDLFMFVANEEHFGHLIDAENTTTEHLHNDLWEIFANPLDWKEKYIHENYSSVAADNVPLENVSQPCPDVFWWPFLSETFAKHMTEEMEFFGRWSDGSNTNRRSDGGHENSPKKEIHLRHIDWERHWMQVLQSYVYSMQMKLYKGYYDEPRSNMNIVARYKPIKHEKVQAQLDFSSYTLNVALNQPGVDYEGGDISFKRYHCGIKRNKVGWVLMHPGRVTHIHEDSPTTKGTRYNLITFINT